MNIELIGPSNGTLDGPCSVSELKVGDDGRQVKKLKTINDLTPLGFTDSAIASIIQLSYMATSKDEQISILVDAIKYFHVENKVLGKRLQQVMANSDKIIKFED